MSGIDSYHTELAHDVWVVECIEESSKGISRCFFGPYRRKCHAKSRATRMTNKGYACTLIPYYLGPQRYFEPHTPPSKG